MPAQILLADDSATIRGFVKLALRGLPVELVEAEDGVQGLERARASRCVLALIDVQMPNLDGMQLLKALRAESEPALRTLPVLLMTAERSESVRIEAEALGAAGFVQKPIQMPELRAAVMAALERAGPV